MSKPSTGALRPLSVGFEARIRIDDAGNRKCFALIGLPPKDEEGARARCAEMATMALRLRRAGQPTDRIIDLMTKAAKVRTGKPWDAIVGAVDILTSESGVEPLSEAARITVANFGKKWRDGDLHREFPDHVAAVDHTRNNVTARVYVDPIIGDRRMADLTLEDAEEVMAAIEGLGKKIPGGKSTSARRHVAQYIRRILVLSIYPAKIRTTNPIPKGWVPRAKETKAKECLYPDEDRTLLANAKVPLLRRLAYGFLSREGMRTDELSHIEWRDIDLKRGKINLDENKTDDPRDWVLDPGVTRALTTWRERFCADTNDGERVFADAGHALNVAHLADRLRDDLGRAGITRPQLFERSATRRPIRAHDLRATFVTWALANGKTETWVSDRTGHKSSAMINRLGRKARTWTGMDLGAMLPLDQAIPELTAHEQPEPPPSRPDPGDLGSTTQHDSRIARKGGTPSESLGSTAVRCRGSSPLPCTSQDLGSTSERAAHGGGPMMGQTNVDPVEAALADALTKAADAGRFDVVAQLARELEARRAKSSASVVDLASRRTKR